MQWSRLIYFCFSEHVQCLFARTHLISCHVVVQREDGEICTDSPNATPAVAASAQSSDPRASLPRTKHLGAIVSARATRNFTLPLFPAVIFSSAAAAVQTLETVDPLQQPWCALDARARFFV